MAVGWGYVWQGACTVEGNVCAREHACQGRHAWQGSCMAEGDVCGREGMHGGGHAWWQGVCMTEDNVCGRDVTGGIHVRGACVARGHVWWGEHV